MPTLNRLVEPPSANSREMRAYMQAILEVSGLYADQAFNIEHFMKNYRTHLESGRLLKDSSGMYALSAEGREYFSSRLSGDPITPGQHVARSEVIDMIRDMTAIEPSDGWVRFEY